MFIPIDADKAFDKIQHSCMIKKKSYQSEYSRNTSQYNTCYL